MMVDQIGLPADFDGLRTIADERGLLLVDDAATALGGRYRSKWLGGIAPATCFSFHPRKMITTGEGGMLTTDNEDWAERARVLRSAGASISDLQRHVAKGALLQQYFDAGYNYRMTDVQAAIGIVQLAKLDEMLRLRREQAVRYDHLIAERFGGQVKSPFVPDYAEHAYSSYCITLTDRAPVDASEVVRRMADRNVSCRHGIQPLHLEPYFASAIDVRLPGTEAAARDTMFLPIFPGLREDEQDQVIEALAASLTV
jgi:dTDP-4-amino-4,6-dideoxygalactose transaminase